MCRMCLHGFHDRCLGMAFNHLAAEWRPCVCEVGHATLLD